MQFAFAHLYVVYDNGVFHFGEEFFVSGSMHLVSLTVAEVYRGQRISVIAARSNGNDRDIFIWYSLQTTHCSARTLPRVLREGHRRNYAPRCMCTCRRGCVPAEKVANRLHLKMCIPRTQYMENVGRFNAHLPHMAFHHKQFSRLGSAACVQCGT